MAESKKNELKIDLTQMIVKVYNKIALWHNEECSNEEKGIRLKSVSHEIIELILNDSLEQLDVQTKMKIVSGEEYVKERKKEGPMKDILQFKEKTKKIKKTKKNKKS